MQAILKSFAFGKGGIVCGLWNLLIHKKNA